MSKVSDWIARLQAMVDFLKLEDQDAPIDCYMMNDIGDVAYQQPDSGQFGIDVSLLSRSPDTTIRGPFMRSVDAQDFLQNLAPVGFEKGLQHPLVGDDVGRQLVLIMRPKGQESPMHNAWGC
jgi:hypothetical protein